MKSVFDEIREWWWLILMTLIILFIGVDYGISRIRCYKLGGLFINNKCIEYKEIDGF